MCKITAEHTWAGFVFSIRVDLEELRRQGNRQRIFAKASGNYMLSYRQVEKIIKGKGKREKLIIIITSPGSDCAVSYTVNGEVMGSNTVEALNLSWVCLQLRGPLVLCSSHSLSVVHAHDSVILICHSSPVMWTDVHAVDLAPNVRFHIKLGHYSTACYRHCQKLL